MMLKRTSPVVIPAKAAIQRMSRLRHKYSLGWMPAFAGMTKESGGMTTSESSHG